MGQPLLIVVIFKKKLATYWSGLWCYTLFICFGFRAFFAFSLLDSLLIEIK